MAKKNPKIISANNYIIELFYYNLIGINFTFNNNSNYIDTLFPM